MRSSGGGTEEAFSHIEQAKSRTLFDLMFQPVHALAREEASESQLAHSIRELRDELNWDHHLVELEHSGPAITPASAAAFQRESEHASRTWCGSCGADDDGLAAVRPACATISSLDAIRAALPEEAPRRVLRGRRPFRVVPAGSSTGGDRAISVMSRSPSTCGCCSFSSRSSGWRRLPPHVSRGAAQSTQAHLHELFNELLAPVWSGSRAASDHVPHGLLHYVPFHALYSGARYVTDACVVSYALSASIYATCQQQPAGGGHGALVLGVADEQAPFIEAEARAVAAALPDPRLVVGADATEQVLRTRGRDCRILHIASHGISARRPDVLGYPPGRHLSERLRPLSTRMRADLVTLSGCATGAKSPPPAMSSSASRAACSAPAPGHCSSACGSFTTRAPRAT